MYFTEASLSSTSNTVRHNILCLILEDFFMQHYNEDTLNISKLAVMQQLKSITFSIIRKDCPSSSPKLQRSRDRGHSKDYNFILKQPSISHSAGKQILCCADTLPYQTHLGHKWSLCTQEASFMVPAAGSGILWTSYKHVSENCSNEGFQKDLLTFWTPDKSFFSPVTVW